MKRLVCLIAATLSVVAVLVFVPAVGAQQEDPGVVRVSIQDGFFDPADIVVAPGTTVEWVNEGNNPHSVIADDGQFDSGLLNPGDSFRVTFFGQGTLTYHCSPSMAGSVTVAPLEPASGDTDTSGSSQYDSQYGS
jgi:plastocyanin